MLRSATAQDIITAFEHTSVPVGAGGDGELTHAEVDRLLRIGMLRRGFCTREYGAVRFAQFCGVVSLGRRLLEVLPKTHDTSDSIGARSMIVRMLRLAGSASVFEELPVGHARIDERLLDVFIRAFFDSVATLVRGGLIKQYQALSDDLLLVRGRIRPSRQFGALANRPDVVACDFDELDVDNRWNRIVKSGVHAALAWTRDVELTRRGFELLAGFDQVLSVPIEQHQLDRVRFDRAGERYRRAIDWVRLISETRSPALRAGRVSSHGLLFDMNQLFERTVFRWLAGHLAPLEEISVDAQVQDRHLAREVEGRSRHFPLRPDLVIRRGERVIAVADTKWKPVRVSKRGYLLPGSGDVYQMAAYASAFGVDRLALIYPWRKELEGSRESTYVLRTHDQRRVTLRVVCVALEKHGMPAVRGASFLERISSFASLS